MIPEESQRVRDLPLEKLHGLVKDLALWGKEKQSCDHILLSKVVGSSPVHKEPSDSTGDFSKGKAFLFSILAHGREH